MLTQTRFLLAIGLLLALMLSACGTTQPPLPAGVLAGSTTDPSTDGDGLDAPLIWQDRTIGEGETCRGLRMAADGQVKIVPCGDAEEEVLLFPGQPDLDSPAWQRAIEAWVAFTYGEETTGQRGAASRTAMSWWLGEVPGQPDACRHLLVLVYGYAYANIEPCDGGPVLSTTEGWLTTPELEAFDLWHYERASLYQENNYFEGRSGQEMSTAERTEMAEWAAAVYERIAAVSPAESATSSRQTLLSWQGYTTLGNADGTQSCMQLTLTDTGEATFGPCDGDEETSNLLPIQAQTWAQIQQHFAPMTWQTAETQLLFEGSGDESADVWKRALATWAEFTVAELSHGRAGAASRTAMSWWLAQTPNDAETCAHLTVLAHGYAYADVTPCAGGQAVQHVEGWLTTAEMEAFDAWHSNVAPTYAGDNYLDGRGEQPMEPAQVEEVTAWAQQIYDRLQTENVQ